MVRCRPVPRDEVTPWAPSVPRGCSRSASVVLQPPPLPGAAPVLNLHVTKPTVSDSPGFTAGRPEFGHVEIRHGAALALAAAAGTHPKHCPRFSASFQCFVSMLRFNASFQCFVSVLR